MHGFFVTVNCSKIFDSDETSYKIFIDKSKMSIVYELVEWIRFMFSLEKCIFLIHENSVIHELEDIKVLEILKSLEIRPCLRSNCIHKKMENNLFSKLDLFTYWKEMRIHKLFESRYHCLLEKVAPNQQCDLKIKNKLNIFSLQPEQNFFEQTGKSELEKNQHALAFPSELNHKVDDEATEIVKESMTDEHQSDLKKDNASLNKKNSNPDETEIENYSFNQNLMCLTHSKSNKLNLNTDCSKSSSVIKTKRIHFKPKKIEIPFSLGTLLADIRSKAQSQELNEKNEIDQLEKCSSVCSPNEIAEDEVLHAGSAELAQNNNSREFKRKRKRKHKRQNLAMNSGVSPNNLSWDYYEPSVKPNHIRFKDVDEEMETETIENNSNSFLKTPVNFNFLEVPSNISEQIVTPPLTAESNPLTKINESDGNLPVVTERQGDICEEFISTNIDKQTDNGTEKRELENTQQNSPDLELIKQKIKHPKICLRFY